MHWDYRVIQHTDHYIIHEVYYDEQGEPVGFSPDAAWPIGTTVEELSHCMIHMMGAFTKPVIPSTDLQRRKQRDTSIDTAINLVTGKADV